MRAFPKAAILDDTGRRCELVSVARLRWDERQSDPAFAAAVHRLSRALLVEHTNAKVIWLLILCVIGGAITSATLLVNYTPMLSFLVWAVPAFALYRLIRRDRLKQIAKQIADILLTNGICPGCAYNLAGQPVTDELVGCSECGAMWNRSRIARSHSFGQRASRSETRRLRLWWERVKAFEPHGPTSIFDDRSYERPVVSPRLVLPIRAAEGEHRVRLVEARKEMVSHGSIRRLLAVCAFPLLAYIIIVANFRTGNPVNITMGLILIPMIVYSGVFTLRGAAGIKAFHIKDAMLRHHLCPSCASDLELEGERLSGDFCNCPECGAAWKLGKQPGSQSPARDLDHNDSCAPT